MLTAGSNPSARIAVIPPHIVNVTAGHVVCNKFPALRVVFDELMPTASGAVFDSSANAGNDNAVTIGGGPSIFNPANFPNFSDLRPRVLKHLIKSSLNWPLVPTNRVVWSSATDVASASGVRSVAFRGSVA